VLSKADGFAQLDVKPDGQDWQWGFVPPERAREALACGLAAISGGWKVYISLADAPNTQTIEIVGLSNSKG
jgi:hypothetical protein